MKDKDLLRLHQLEETLKPFRNVARAPTPTGGWIRAIREALGMTNVQLARRLGKASQTIEDIQKSEVNGTVQLKTLREIAGALGCEVAYALVPPKPLPQIRRDRAREKALRSLRTVSHSMKLEDQGVNAKEEKRQLEIMIERLLAGNPKKLWE
jgi:predicted DNA-binding mobile mystery protein A